MQTHPWAPEFSRIPFQVRSYGVLAEVSLCCPPLKGRFSTYYSPVRHFPLTEVRFSFDLHVWSTPPAFVLSQDQTLHCQKVYVHRIFRANWTFCSTSFLLAFASILSFESFFEINKYFRFQLFYFQCSIILFSLQRFANLFMIYSRYRGSFNRLSRGSFILSPDFLLSSGLLINFKIFAIYIFKTYLCPLHVF